MYYGWWVVVAAFLIQLYVGGIIILGFTAFFEPIANEFGWSYVQISLASSLRGLEVGLLAPLMGLLVDRWGPSKLLFAGAIITGVGMILLSRTNSLGMFYGAFILISIGMSTRSGTVLFAAVVNWFRRKVGIATGIVTSGIALGGLMVSLVTLTINTFDWRTAMVIFGLGMWVIFLPLSLLVRHKPKQYDYLPDDRASVTVVDENLTSAQSAEKGMGARRALKSSTFWHIALALMYQSLVVSAMLTHVMPYLSSIGIARSTSSLVASAIPLASIGGRLGFGWLGDRFDSRWGAVVCFALIGFSLLLFSHVAAGGIWLLVSFLILFSTGWGGSVAMRVALIRKHFGRSRFGTMHGFTAGIMMVGNIAGAPLAGWVFDKSGSYQGAWLAFAGVSIAAIVLIATTPPVDTTTQSAYKLRA